MFRTGVNFIDGIAVEVTRKRIRRINLHVGRDGLVHLSVPFPYYSARIFASPVASVSAGVPC